ncbi:hypothetical protein Drorol1_Dr00014786 [Drosera rotundifolia]
MDLAVVGRHALFFDDDGAAAFVNSKEALVEWNSLSIDRYDVRHLLSDPPSSFRNNHRRNQSTPVDSDLEKEIDAERYADLREEESSPESDRPAGYSSSLLQSHIYDYGEAGAQYSAVPFSYGNTIGSSDQKNAEAESESSRFRPPFPLPEGLLLHLPPTEKMHQIIARTSTYVSEHGGQSEIVLRVKQGDNPTFGFLMPHHHLHPYFRYLVDHQELLKAGIDADSQKDTTLQANGVGAGGALSLLGSVYGSAEDDESPGEDPMESKRNTSSGTTTAAHGTNSNHVKEPEEAGKVSRKDDRVSKVPHLFKDKAVLVSSSQINTTVKPGTFCGKRKESGMSSSSSGIIGKEIASAAASMSIVEMTLIEPPSDLKRSIDRVAELVLKNGNEFEANLVEQVKQHGRFEFLLRSNKYHPYYLKVLRMNQEFKNTIMGRNFEKDGPSWQVIDKKSPTNERDLMSETSDVQDLPLELDRKEKFKMFIGKSKKDAVDQPKGVEPQYGVSLDAAATAAILHAATRGIKYSNLEILKLPSSGANHLVGHEEMQASGSGNLTVSRAEGLAQKENEAAHTGMEAGMTKEQKLKAERLKRAKMFAAMIKSGAAAPGKDPLRGLSVEPPEPVISVSPKDLMTREDATEVKGPLLPLDEDSKKSRKSEKTDSSYEKRDNESKKRQHYRSRRHGEDEGEGEEEEDAIDQSPSQKKHKSHRSSDHHRGRSKDRHKRQEQHSSSKREESRHQHKHTSSSEDEGTYRRKKRADSDEDEHEKHRHKNPKSSKDEKRHRRSSSRHDVLSGYDDSRHRHKHDESFEADARDRSHRHKLKDSGGDENGRHRRSTKHMKGHHAEDPELEEGEISTKSSNQSLSSTGNGDVSVQKAPSVSPETTEVPDDLRAKIRAMLLATL